MPGKILDIFCHQAPYTGPYDSVQVRQQEEKIQVNVRLVSLCPAAKVYCIFSSRFLIHSYGESQKARSINK